jgi:hypothetical protein
LDDRQLDSTFGDVLSQGEDMAEVRTGADVCLAEDSQPMSAPTLAEAVAQYGRDAYLLTVANDGPHTSFVSVDLEGNVIACAVGKSAARNIASTPNVSLFWPPREPGGYALVVNGTANGRREPSGLTRVEITLTKSVLHRAGPKPPDSDGPCPSDCRRITRPA